MLSWREHKWLVLVISDRPRPSWRAIIAKSRSRLWLLSNNRWCSKNSNSKSKAFTVNLAKLLTAQVKKKSNKLWKWAEVVAEAEEAVASLVLLRHRCVAPQWVRQCNNRCRWMPCLNSKWWWVVLLRCKRGVWWNRKRQREGGWCKKTLWPWKWMTMRTWWWNRQCPCKHKLNQWLLLRKSKRLRLPATLAARSVLTTRCQHNFSRWANNDESNSKNTTFTYKTNFNFKHT